MKNYKLTISEIDYIQAQRLHSQLRPLFRILIRLLLVLFICKILLSFVDYFNGNSFEVSSCFFVAFIIYVVLLKFFIVPSRLRKLYAQSKLLQMEVVYSFNKEAFLSKSENGNTILNWPNFHKWKSDKNLILLYQADNVFNIIPKRIFGSESEIEEVELYITSSQGIKSV